jgi:hypothetical protein
MAALFPRIDCRLGLLATRVQAAGQGRLAALVSQAKASHEDADRACAAGDAAGARRALQRATGRMVQYLRGLRSRAGTLAVPAHLRVDLDVAGDQVRSDLETLRVTLRCPAA